MYDDLSNAEKSVAADSLVSLVDSSTALPAADNSTQNLSPGGPPEAIPEQDIDIIQQQLYDWNTKQIEIQFGTDCKNCSI